MPVPVWSVGDPTPGPVYLDANVLIGFVTAGHPLGASAGQVVSEVLASGQSLVLSDLVMSESAWGLAREAFRIEIRPKGGEPTWGGEKSYLRFHAAIFGRHAKVVGSVLAFLGSLQAAGHPIDVVGGAMPAWLGYHQRAMELMQAFRLAPSDATHLALASVWARTFITADRKFRDVVGPDAPAGLVMYMLP